MAVMISINPPYTTMIMSGHKWLEFRNQIIKTIRGYPDGTLVYIYETKNKGGKGLIIGEATILDIYRLGYNFKGEDNDIVHSADRHVALKQLYLDWCTKNKNKPNLKEGWNESEQFKTYIEKIGWGGNYGLFLDNITKYERPKMLSEFVNAKGSTIQRPPQNMFNCTLKI